MMSSGNDGGFIAVSAAELVDVHLPDVKRTEKLYPPNLWIRLLLSESAYDEPYALYSNPAENKLLIGTLSDFGCIHSEWRPSREMIDFDVVAATDIVLDAARCPAGQSTKPIVATVRGNDSGGKTRALLEIRKQLLFEHIGVLPLAINFNTRIRISKATDPWGVDDTKLICVLAVLSRLLQVFYGTDDEAELELAYSEEIKTKHTLYIKSMLPLLDTAKMAKENSHGDVIRYCLLHMVRQLSTYRPINTVVLLIDDAQRLENHIVDDLKRKDIPFGGVLSVIRNAILNRPIGANIKAAMVVSSVGLSPVGQSQNPKRPVWPLLLPSRLTVEEILNNWWKMGDRTEPERHALKLLAATICELPSLICTAKRQYIDRKRHKFVDATFLRRVIHKVEHSRPMSKAPPVELLHALIYGCPCALKGDVINMLSSRSFLSNVLTSFRETDEIVPECSLLLLKRSLEMASIDDAPNTLYLRRALCDCLRSLFQALVNMAPTKPEREHTDDQIIEDADPQYQYKQQHFTQVLLYHWMFVRWVTALLIKERRKDLQTRLDLYHSDPVAFLHSGMRLGVDTFRDDAHRASLEEKTSFTLGRLLGLDALRFKRVCGESGDDTEERWAAAKGAGQPSAAAGTPATANTAVASSSFYAPHAAATTNSKKIPLPLPVLCPSVQEALFDNQLADEPVVVLPGMHYIRTLHAESREERVLDDVPDIFLLLSLIPEVEKNTILRTSNMPVLVQERKASVELFRARKRFFEEAFQCEAAETKEGEWYYESPALLKEEHALACSASSSIYSAAGTITGESGRRLIPPTFPGDLCILHTEVQKEQVVQDLVDSDDNDESELSPFDAISGNCFLGSHVSSGRRGCKGGGGNSSSCGVGATTRRRSEKAANWSVETVKSSFFVFIDSTSYRTTFDDISPVTTMFRRPDDEDDGNDDDSYCGGGDTSSSDDAIDGGNTRRRESTQTPSSSSSSSSSSSPSLLSASSSSSASAMPPHPNTGSGDISTRSRDPFSSLSSSACPRTNQEDSTLTCATKAQSSSAAAACSERDARPCAKSCVETQFVVGTSASPTCGSNSESAVADVHTYTLDELPDHGERYLRTVAAVGDALQFLYVYVSTRPDTKSGVVAYPPLSNVPGGDGDPAMGQMRGACMVLGREEALGMLGPMAGLFQVAMGDQ